MPLSYKEASKAAKLSALDGLGSSKVNFESEEKLTPIETAIGNFIKRVKANIQSADMNVSGKINDINVQKKGDVIEVLAYPELIFQDKGVNGAEVKLYNTPFSYKTKRPPVGPFKKWIEDKNIQLRNNEKYKGKGSSFKEPTKEQEIDSAAYAIREKVYQEGFKPRKVYSKEIPQLIKDAKEGLKKYVVQEVFKSLSNGNKANH